MVTDNQVRILVTTRKSGKTKAVAAAKAGMDEKTARKYLRLCKLPSDIKVEHTWRTLCRCMAGSQRKIRNESRPAGKNAF
jgi:hypothetical protein